MAVLLIWGPTHTAFPCFLADERSINILGPLNRPHIGATTWGLHPQGGEEWLSSESGAIQQTQMGEGEMEERVHACKVSMNV